MTRNEHDGSKRGGPGPRRNILGQARAKPAVARTDEATSPDEAKDGRQRIAKLMARAGLCSRRDAEAWIVDGRVSVNGTILTTPALDVGPADVVLVDGAPLPAADKTRLFLFHKPKGLVTSDHDPEGRATVFDHLREHWPDGPRVVTIGRLDINTEGLLLLTNDGGLARVLELPATGWVRRYRVRAKGETDQAVLDGLAAGVTIDGIEYAGIEAKLDRVQGANCWLTMGLREGKNREVKRVLEHIGLEVNRLIRISFGPFQLLDLPEGAVEEVKTRILRDQLGATLAAKAGVDFSEPEPLAPVVAAPFREARGKEKVSRATARDSAAPRGRNFRDRDRAEETPPEAPQIRERPVSGPRRHISALRADAAGATGPRKRVERTETADRKNRSVTVERLVTARPDHAKPASRRERIEPASRRERTEPATRRERTEPASRRERDTIPERRERTGPAGPGGKRPYATDSRLSQSALGKRERIARSGGESPEPRAPRSRSERSFSDNRAARSEERASRRPARNETSPAPGERIPARSDRSAARREKPFPRDENASARGEKSPARRTGSGEREGKLAWADRKPVQRPARDERSGRDDRPGGARSRTPASAKPGREARSAGRPATGRAPKREFGGKPQRPAKGGKPAGRPSAKPQGSKPQGGKPPRRPRG